MARNARRPSPPAKWVMNVDEIDSHIEDYIVKQRSRTKWKKQPHLKDNFEYIKHGFKGTNPDYEGEYDDLGYVEIDGNDFYRYFIDTPAATAKPVAKTESGPCTRTAKAPTGPVIYSYRYHRKLYQ